MSRWIYHILILFISSFFIYQSAPGQSQLSSKEFAKGIQSQDAQLLDVRTLQEYNSGYIKGAFLADWNDPSSFEERIQYLDKTKPVYAYCLSGVRSAAAAKKLHGWGFKEVYSMKGGIQEWKNEKMPLENTLIVKQISADSLLQSFSKDSLVLLDIGAAWCPPCKKMEPVIEDLKKNTHHPIKIVKIDAGEQFAFSKELKADKLPTFIIYRQGKEVWRKSGIVSKSVFLQQL